MNSVHVQLGYFSLNCWILKRTRKGTHINYSNKKWMPATYMSKEMDGQSGWDSDNGAKIEGNQPRAVPSAILPTGRAGPFWHVPHLPIQLVSLGPYPLNTANVVRKWRSAGPHDRRFHAGT